MTHHVKRNPILKYRFWIFLAITIALFGAGLGWLHFSKKPLEQTKSPLSVTVIEPQVQTKDAHLHLSGLTAPREEILVMSELAGLRVQEVFAQVGQQVEKGQLLVSLNSESVAHQVAQLSYEYARILDEYERIYKLKETGAISKQLLIQKQSESELAKDRLEDAKLNLSKTRVLAPKKGLIFERKAVIGEVVHANQPLYRIAHGAVEFQADVPEAKLATIKVGQKVNMLFSGHTGLIKGTVRLVEPNIDYASRTASIRIQLEKTTVQFPIGLFGQAQIVMGAITGALLPQSAVQQDAHGFYVWVLDKENKATRYAVHIKLHTQGYVIVEPFASGTKVVAKAGAFVSQGEKLETIEVSAIAAIPALPELPKLPKALKATGDQ